MTEPDVQEFVGLLRKSRLLDTAALRKVERSLSQSDSASVLADALVSDGLLTVWQREQLLQRQTGFVLRQYRLLSPVGRGGMGHVFRARDDRTGDIVAIKVMARKLSTNQVLVDRFRREIKAASQLNSPHVVRAVDAGRVGRVDFMVMEFVNGDQLDRIANRIGVLPPGLAGEIIRQAAAGLQHAHEKRMVHRDIKPSNLIIGWQNDGAGIVKVMDLGLVRLEQEELEQRSVTRTGQVMGTPDYMSPEQAWNTARADIRSDIYSLGCTFFRLLTGRVPFPGDNPLQVLMARCSRDVPSVGSVRSDIPEPLQDIAARMTRRDPAARYQTPGEIVAALAPFCSPLTVESLRAAAKQAVASESSADSGGTPPNGSIAAADVDYEQFLQEMGSGAAVDLMTSTADVDFSTTRPDEPLPALVAEPPRYATRSRRRRSSSRPWLLPVSLAGTVVLAIALLFTLASPGEPAGNDGNGQVPKTVWVVPELVMAAADPIAVRAGETAELLPAWRTNQEGAGGTLRFSLDADAPAGATVDATTGHVHWPTSTFTTPGSYELLLLAHWTSSERSVEVLRSPIEVRVRPGPLSVALHEPQPVRAVAGERLSIPVVSDGFSASEAGASFQLGSGATDGMTVDAETGQFVWTPTENDMGRHQVQLMLFEDATGQMLASTELKILVAPSSIRVSLPDFPEQRAVAGERFEMSLADRPLPMRVVRLSTGPSAPEGIQLDVRTARLTWNIPADASGRVEIPLMVEPAVPGVEFTPDSRTSTVIVVVVEPAEPATRAPAEAEVTAAIEKLRTLFRRDLTSARTATARAELAASLLERSYGQSPGAEDFALLNLAAEQADRGGAFDLLFETEFHRASRYATDESEALRPVLTRLRRGSGRSLQQDLVVEHCLRIAHDLAADGDFGATAEFLGAAEQFLRNGSDISGSRQLSGDVALAREIAETLRDADRPQQQTVQIQELRRLLERWQFHDLFDQLDTLSFLQDSGSATPLPENGRSLWKFDERRLLMGSPPRDGLTGFLETTRRPERFVIRMHVAPRTTSASLIFGGSVTADLSGFLLVLDGSGFGRLQQMPGPAPLRDPPENLSLNSTLPNLVEVYGGGEQLVVRVNGNQVIATRLPEDAGGQIGLLCSLVRPEPGAVVDIRRPRLLVLPGGE